MKWHELIPCFYQSDRYRAIQLASLDGRWVLTFDMEQIGAKKGYKTLEIAQAAAKHINKLETTNESAVD